MDKVISRYYNDGKLVENRISNYYEFEKTKNIEAIARMIYWRLYGRYIKPFEFDNPTYKKDYKNGFVMMASCCLLIETYIGYRVEKSKLLKSKPDSKNVVFNSPKHFAYFFRDEQLFSLCKDEFSEKNPESWIFGKTEKNFTNDFYYNVRCGILHYGDTRNGWTINRENNENYIDPSNKTINAYAFMSRLKKVLELFTANLESNKDWDSIEWKIVRDKMEDVIANCKEVL
jgi:hypothetical protein